MIEATQATSPPHAVSGLDPAVTITLPTLLHRLTASYTAGDAPLAEQLLLEALDQGLPWDVVCTAAAEGIAAHRDGRRRA